MIPFDFRNVYLNSVWWKIWKLNTIHSNVLSLNYEWISILRFRFLAVIRTKIMFYLLLMGQKALEQDPTSVQQKYNGRGWQDILTCCILVLKEPLSLKCRKRNSFQHILSDQGNQIVNGLGNGISAHVPKNVDKYIIKSTRQTRQLLINWTTKDQALVFCCGSVMVNFTLIHFCGPF